MIRARSETVSVSPQPATQQRLLFALRTNGLYWKTQHFALRLSFQISPSTVPTTKSNTWTSPSTAPTTKSDTWTSPSTAPATKSDTWTSPSTAPTTKSDTWPSPSTAPTTKSDTWTSPSTAPTTQSDTWPSPTTVPTTQSDTWNLTKYCAYHQKWHLTFTKYCACHTEWLAGLILVTYETSFPMCGETNVTLQTHQILRLPRKITMQHLAEICEKQLKRHFHCAADPRMIRARSETVSVSPQPATQQRLLFALRTNGLYWKTQHFALRLSFQISPSTAPTKKSNTWTSPSTAPTTKSDTWTSPSTAPATKSDTWTSPSIAPTTKSDTWPSPSTAPTTQSATWTSPSTARLIDSTISQRL